MDDTLYVYYTIILVISLIYIFNKVGLNKLSIFIVFVFWQGLFGFLNFYINNLFNLYKIFIVFYAIYIFWPNLIKTYSRHEKYVNIAFVIFSISFWISYYFNKGEIITLLSQYLYKYGLVFIIYHGFKDIIYKHSKREYIKKVLLQILYIQVVLSVIKILVFGFPREPIVGSMSNGGAGTAVVIPIMALFFYWIIHNGNLRIKDWLIISLFIIIALASGKRAPVILFPLFALLLVVSVKSPVKFISYIKYLPLLFMVFYFGARLIPTLNPEGEVWGSFNISHIRNYSLIYNFGTSDLDVILSEEYETQGRGGGIFLIVQPEKLGLLSYKEKLFGKGVYELVIGQKGKLGRGSVSFSEHTGNLGRVNVIMWSIGLFGLISMILFSIIIINTINDRRFRWVVLIFYLYELFFYGNQVVFSNPSAIMLVFICFYANTIDKLPRTHMINRMVG